MFYRQPDSAVIIIQPLSCDSDQLLIGLPIIFFLNNKKIVFNFNGLLFYLVPFFMEFLCCLSVHFLTEQIKKIHAYND